MVTRGELTLQVPHRRHRRSFLAAAVEFEAEGSHAYSSFRSTTLESLRTDFGEYVDQLHDMEHPTKPLADGWVPMTERWMLVGGLLVGRISIRHELNDWLREVGGHIGYAVRPSARRNGYATQALAQALPIAAALGIESVLVTCDVDNVGSRRTIESNGGMLENIANGKRRYWIPTGRTA